MEFKKNRKVDISYQNITLKNIRPREEKLMIILMKYIQMVLNNMKDQFIERSISRFSKK